MSEAKLLKYSISPGGKKIATFEIYLPKVLLAEYNIALPLIQGAWLCLGGFMNLFERIALNVLEEQREMRLTDATFNIIDTKSVNNYVNKNFVNEFAQRITAMCGYYADAFQGLGCPVDMDPTETKPSDYIKKMMNTPETYYENGNEGLYVILTYNKTQERWQLCYQFNTPFVGTYDEAKVAHKELQEWMPEEKYVIYKVVEA